MGLQEDATEEDDMSDPSGSDACKTNVCTLLRSIGVNNPQISRAFRMGKRQPDRPRPIKVMCVDVDTRRMSLENAKKLKNLPDSNPNKKVFIRQDLTQLQRDHDYLKRQSRNSHHTNSVRSQNPPNNSIGAAASNRTAGLNTSH
jgi:hypothetical protein